MSQIKIPLPQQRGFGQTSRKDNWWLVPLGVFCGLSAFIVYSTWAAFQGEHYFLGLAAGADGFKAQYLSPFYSPLLFDAAGQLPSGHAWFGAWPDWFPAWLPATPALLILWAPGGFRFTCYYYRGAYYKAFWMDPPSCAVGEPRNAYRGEKKFPLVMQNVHRYFLYLALAFLVILAYDAWKAMWFANSQTGATELGKKFELPLEHNPEADKASWAKLQEFLNSIFAG